MKKSNIKNNFVNSYKNSILNKKYLWATKK